MNSKEIDDFPVLKLFKEFLFGDASYHITHARQINLRILEELQIQTDVILLCASILKSIKKVTSDIIYTLIDKSLYVELRNTGCGRFTIYNERRRREPARIFIEKF